MKCKWGGKINKVKIKQKKKKLKRTDLLLWTWRWKFQGGFETSMNKNLCMSKGLRIFYIKKSKVIEYDHTILIRWNDYKAKYIFIAYLWVKGVLTFCQQKISAFVLHLHCLLVTLPLKHSKVNISCL